MYANQADQERHEIVQAYIQQRQAKSHEDMLYEKGAKVLRFKTCEHAAYMENKDKYFCTKDPRLDCKLGLVCVPRED